LRPNYWTMINRRFLNIIYPILLIGVVFIVWKYRENQKPASQQTVRLSGMTMGTIQYNITYLHPEGLDLSKEIDSLLKVWNQSLSTYIPESEISRFNLDSCFIFESKYFHPVLSKSQEVFEKTNGAFDPSVGPLVNAWGFGPDDSMNPDSSTIDSLRNFVGFNKVIFDNEKVCKSVKGLELDFSAIAKGYAVDVVSDYIRSHDINNLLVEIGGELMCLGHNDQGKPWRTGIENPKVRPEEQKLYAIANISDLAIATSGNYRNYYEKDGTIYSHTIDPSMGYPVQRNILSASVFAEDCMTADAYATAFMVLGLEESKKVLEREEDIEGFLIYSDEDGKLNHYITEAMKDKIEMIDGQ